MHIVVDIPEEVYRAYKMDMSLSFLNEDQRSIASWYLRSGLVDGKPLPKGHGALKDTDKIISDGISKGFCDWYDEIKYADTIIEADKGSEDKG